LYEYVTGQDDDHVPAVVVSVLVLLAQTKLPLGEMVGGVRFVMSPGVQSGPRPSAEASAVGATGVDSNRRPPRSATNI